MKVSFSALSRVAMCALLLSGCGGSLKGDESNPSPDMNCAEDEQVEYPITLATQYGEVTIDKKPERVVALGMGDAEVAIELGVQPVGTSDWMQFGGDGLGPWLNGSYAEKPALLATFDVNYTDVAALKPDLILDTRGWQNKGRFEKLTKIAPTVAAAPSGQYSSDESMQLAMLGKALGAPCKAKSLEKNLEKNIADQVARHSGWKGATFSVVTRSAAGWGAYAQGSSVTFLERLGLQLNPALTSLPDISSDKSTISLSEESLGKVEANVVFAVPVQVNDSEITNSAAWKAIPAVAEGRSLILDSDVQRALELGTPAASNYALKKLSDSLEKLSMGK